MNYKPGHHNSLSPYIVVDGAEKYMDLLLQIFDGELFRRYEGTDDRIVHPEGLLSVDVIDSFHWCASYSDG